MNELRIDNHPILGQRPEQQKINFIFDGLEMEGYLGEPIAAALLANRIRILRRHEESGTPRGIYCAIGHCMECRVQINNRPSFVRACITPLEEGMVIHPGQQLSNEITGRKADDEH